MSENPLQGVCQTVDKISHCVQTHLSHFSNSMFGINNNNNNNNYTSNKNSSSLIQNTITTSNTTASVLLHSNHEITTQQSKAQPASKEELGRCTWTFLHTLGAQYPDKPTRQQRRDAKELMEILSRMYPCKDCADHFKEVLRSNPVQAGSQAELSQWLCHVHNVVNRSLGKVTFQCERVDARWGKLECDQRACDLQGTMSFGDDLP